MPSAAIRERTNATTRRLSLNSSFSALSFLENFDSEWISSSDRNRSRVEQWVDRNPLGIMEDKKQHRRRLSSERVWESSRSFFSSQCRSSMMSRIIFYRAFGSQMPSFGGQMRSPSFPSGAVGGKQHLFCDERPLTPTAWQSELRF